MRCNDALELQSALLDGELGARESRDVEAHLAACTHCQATLKDLQDLSGSLRAQAEYFRAPPDLRSRIGRRFEPSRVLPPAQASPRRSAPGFSLPSWWPGWGMGAAVPVAAAILAFTVGVQFAGAVGR